MPNPRVEIDIAKIRHNADTLVNRLKKKGISVIGVTKATLGSKEVADAMLAAGAVELGDARIENIRRLKVAQVTGRMNLIRPPMLSQVEQVIQHADVSFNSELNTIQALSQAAKKANKQHGIILAVEMGDLREGIMPEDIESVVRQILSLPNITFKGIATNLACRSGVVPDDQNMTELSSLADALEENLEIKIEVVSGGNSANLQWAFRGQNTGRINQLRLGESILLGVDPLTRKPIDGLYTDAFHLVAEVIESKLKPTHPTGQVAQNAWGEAPTVPAQDKICQTIVALGHQDTDPAGLAPIDPGISILGASGDHLILGSTEKCFEIGSEIKFSLNYPALVRGMTSPFIEKEIKRTNALK